MPWADADETIAERSLTENQCASPIRGSRGTSSSRARVSMP